MNCICEWSNDQGDIEGVVGLDAESLKLLKPNGAIGEPAGDHVVELVK